MVCGLSLRQSLRDENRSIGCEAPVPVPYTRVRWVNEGRPSLRHLGACYILPWELSSCYPSLQMDHVRFRHCIPPPSSLQPGLLRIEEVEWGKYSLSSLLAVMNVCDASTINGSSEEHVRWFLHMVPCVNVQYAQWRSWPSFTIHQAYPSTIMALFVFSKMFPRIFCTRSKTAR